MKLTKLIEGLDILKIEGAVDRYLTNCIRFGGRYLAPVCVHRWFHRWP